MSYEKRVEETKTYPAILARIMDQASRLKVIRVPRPPKELLKNISKVDIEENFRWDSLVSGVDGGSSGKNLEGFYFGVVSALSYTSSPYEVVDTNPVCDGSVYRILSSQGSLWLSLLEHKLVFGIALKTAMERHPDFLFIDGSLLLLPAYFLTKVDGVEIDSKTTYPQHQAECTSTILRLLEYCYNNDINVVGVVKRPTSQLFNESIRDAALLDRFLKVGEMTRPLSPGKHPAISFYMGRLRRDGSLAPSLKTSIKNLFQVVYVKTTEMKGPLRLEAPSWVSIEDVVKIIMSTTDPLTGVPVHILKADSLVGISSDIYRACYVRMMLTSLQDDPSSESMMRPIRGEEFLILSGEEPS
ncbi:MAG: DNA double-strand break repair nuclease NurA [Candidatus Geothermarchaeales archaeon]